MRGVWAVLMLGMLSGCPTAIVPASGEGSSSSGDATSGRSTSEEDSGGTSTSGGGRSTSTGPRTSLEMTSSTGDEDASDDGVDTLTFLDEDPPPDCSRRSPVDQTYSSQCDLSLQDCCEGEGCKPWANDGGDEWNAVRCTPLSERPDAQGEPCTVEGADVSGVDSCDEGT
ncbi:MAG: hypothetical protein AAGA54_27630, partial [Myxococcota bacterium]